MQLSSPAFSENGSLSQRYSCEGQNVNPPVLISDIPTGSRSLAVLLHDPDAPSGDFVHWLAYDIDPQGKIEEGKSTGTPGLNSSGKLGYQGPCPPPGATHQYHLQVFALDTRLNLPKGASLEIFKSAVRGHVITTSELVGKFSLS